ncbi:MAG: adenylate/guanylate cyclase domain-containing protein [Thermoplasmata archaeon]
MASQRRLSAIMFTDMVGFTARTQSDEAGTLALLEELERLVRAHLAEHHGREVKSTGDGVLVEFPSALEATRCAVAIQERLRERNRATGVPIELRIGLHLGDVEQRGDDIFGDAVNIAARVQPTADAGGIAVSAQVFDQVRNKIGLRLEKLEPKALKGLRVPMEVYRVVLPWNAPSGEPAGGPELRRIAVLPFSNISPDPRDAYLSDGLTEEVITVLSQLRELRVIARTSVEPYRTSPKSVAQVGVELGVGWVLEGSVRKAGNRLRITIQLIDSRSQEHVWAGTYDRELDDVFALQSELAKQVADALEIKLLAREAARLDRRAPPNTDSYLEYLRGRANMHFISEAELRSAKEHFERAIALDASNAAAHAGLSDVHRRLGGTYYHLPVPSWRRAAREHADRAVELDPDLADGHTSVAMNYWANGDYASAEREIQRAIQLNPSLALARLVRAGMLADLGREEEALEELAVGEELDPLSPLITGDRVDLLTHLGRWDVAEAALEKLGRIESHGLLYYDRRASLDLVRGDIEGFGRDIERFNELLPDRPELVCARAQYLARRSQPERARELLRSVEGLPDPVRPVAQIARSYALLGDLDSCFHWLDIAVDLGRFYPRYWRFDPLIAHVRSDPRFTALLRKAHVA